MNLFQVTLLVIFCPRFVSNVGIVGGLEVGNYPFFAFIDLSSHVCGGIFVTPKAVVTAAHCLQSRVDKQWIPNDRIKISKGNVASLFWPRLVQWFFCKRYVIHESFDPSSRPSASDIAIIEITVHMNMSHPANGILEPCPESTDYTQGFVIGMGVTSVRPFAVAERLMGVRLYRHSSCQSFYPQINFDEKKQICFGSLLRHRPAGTCVGDDGGPLLHKDPYTRDGMCFIGIVSYNNWPSCDDSKKPTVFTKAGYFLEWIASIVTEKSVRFDVKK